MGAMAKPDLRDFLLARVAERESTARDMQDQERLGRPFFRLDPSVGGSGIRELIDPTRILAECEAKRRIVEHETKPYLHEGRQVATFRWTPILRYLAAAYSAHPDYDGRWKP